MPRYIRTRTPPRTDTLKEQIAQEVERQTSTLLKQLFSQLSQQLQSNGSSGGAAERNAFGDSSNAGLANFGQLFTSGLRFLLNQPRITRTSAESARSIDTGNQFRVAQSQAAAEAQAALGKGDKNL